MIETERLVLRSWRDEDDGEFARVTNTAAVMRYLGGVVAPSDFAGYAARLRAQEAEHGCCFWIAERKADAALLGFCGLKRGAVGPIDGEIEIGWRLREDAWGQGYASEGARACLAYAWTTVGAPRVRAITVPGNRASRRVMERIGMARRDDLDFDHPQFEPGHPLCRHVVYEATRPD